MEPGELLTQGMEYARTGDRDRARELIAKAVKADPSLIQGWWALVHLLEDKNQRIDCLKQVLKLDPFNDNAQAKLVELQGAPQGSTAASQDPSRAHSRASSPPAPSVAFPPQVETQGPVKRGLIPPGIKASLNRNSIYAAAALVGVILLGVLITLLFTRWILPAISDRSRDDLANLPVPKLPLEWTTDPQIMVLVPTGSHTPTVTQVRPKSSPTVTRTGPPSPTPRPLYTPTITPTFDPRSVATATRASRETCPAAASPGSLTLTDPNDDLYASADEVLAFLNAGGSVAEVRRAVDQLNFNADILSVDLTHDGVQELVLYSFAVYVFGCRDGQYHELLRLQPEILDTYGTSMRIYADDLTLSGVQNLVVTTDDEGFGNHNYYLNVLVFEWNGEELANLSPEPEEVKHPFVYLGEVVGIHGYAFSMFRGEMALVDVDRNGTIEVILTGAGYPSSQISFWYDAYRQETHTWMWNGVDFNLVDVELSAPLLKFHAVQDGDLAALQGQYQDALDSYWRAINDSSLQAWNADILEWNPQDSYPGNPNPFPPPDPDQGKRVEAYARFRIIVTYLLLGQNVEAESQYQLIQQLHPPGDPGYPFAEMALEFYDTYQEFDSVGVGCEAAQAFAVQDESELLYYLSSHVYGGANIYYEAEDLCPFQ